MKLRRLADTGAGSAGKPIGLAVRALRAEHGSLHQVRALEERLAPQLLSPTQAAVGAGSATSLAVGATGWLAKLASPWLGLVAVGALLTGLGLWRDMAPGSATASRARPAASPAPPATKPAAAPREREAVAPPNPSGEPPTAVPAIQTRPTPRRAAPRRQAATKALAPPAPQDELRLLERARAALERDPQRALRWTQQHAERYPTGIFAEEREVLAIEAELKQGLRSAAIARARAFVEHYPRSAHSRRVRALLDTAPATPAEP